MYHYHAFGLNLLSQLPLTGPVSTTTGSRPDLVIEAGCIDYALPPVGSFPVFDYSAPGGTVMIWPGIAGFRITGPEKVVYKQYADSTDLLMPFALLGPVMAWVLHLRGKFLLHASAVEIDGGAVAFIGDKLAGKSTTAAAFVRAGYQMVTDDLLVLDLDAPDRLIVKPGYPQLKLTDGAAAAIPIKDAVAMPPVLANADKRQHMLRRFSTNPLPLRAVYVLDRGGDEPKILDLNFAARIEALARYNYVVRF